MISGYGRSISQTFGFQLKIVTATMSLWTSER